MIGQHGGVPHRLPEQFGAAPFEDTGAPGAPKQATHLARR